MKIQSSGMSHLKKKATIVPGVHLWQCVNYWVLGYLRHLVILICSICFTKANRNTGMGRKARMIRTIGLSTCFRWFSITRITDDFRSLQG